MFHSYFLYRSTWNCIHLNKLTFVVSIYFNVIQIASELPASTNWNFDVHWYPKIPGVISASSFDVKIGIYNIEVLYFFCYLNLTVIFDSDDGSSRHHIK